MKRRIARQSTSRSCLKAKKPKTKIVIDEELFLQPWFVAKATHDAIRRLLPSAQLLRMVYYFEDWGCLRCGRSNVLYRANGMCKVCSIVIRGRVVLALARRFRKIGSPTPNGPIVRFVGLKTIKQVHRRVHYPMPGSRAKFRVY